MWKFTRENKKVRFEFVLNVYDLKCVIQLPFFQHVLGDKKRE